MIAEWSFHPSHDGRFVFFVAGTRAVRLELETLREDVLADFGAVEMREKGMVGAAMGTTTLSRDDRWWAVPVKAGEAFAKAQGEAENKQLEKQHQERLAQTREENAQTADQMLDELINIKR